MPNVAGDRPATRRRALIAATVLAVVALDQATKAWALSTLAAHPRSIVGDDVELRLSRNAGGAFSLFQGFTPLLAAIALVMAVVLVRLLRRAHDPRLLVALALGLGGVIGNLVDRLFRSPGFFRGAVVDFVKLGPWPSFNVADAAITTGAVFLVVHLVLPHRTPDEGMTEAGRR